MEWFSTLFAKQFAIHTLFKFWDNLFINGEVALFRLALQVFARTEFRNRQPVEIIDEMMNLEHLFAQDVHQVLTNEILSVEEFEMLVAKESG